MIVGLDTATPSTVAAVLAPDGAVVERRDDPAPGERPRHAERLLALAEEALAEAGATWTDVARLAVGVGPGGFTGLRIGIATARGLAQAHGIALVPVSSLAALAAGAGAAPGALAGRSGPAEPASGERTVAALVDARRREVFAAAWRGAEPVLAPVASAPADLAARLGGALAVGDGAVRYRGVLAAAGLDVPPDGDPRHGLRGAHLCRLAREAEPVAREALLPEYLRAPDAVPPSRV